jgi:chemotaxis protein methyltransferase CheR
MNHPTTAPTQAALDRDTRPVSDREFALFQRLIYREAGIRLVPAKKALLEARLTRRLRELGLSSFEAYYRHILEVDHGDELIVLLDRISTNETHFFREPKQFEFLENEVFSAWKKRNRSAGGTRHIRVWSAACSSGEEPYSLAMMLSDHFPPGSGWDFEILATDLSTRVLGTGTAGVWPIGKSSEIPQHYLKKYMLKGTGEQSGHMKAGAEIRSVVRFERLNLNDDEYPVAGNLDLIFCRNVLIYFDSGSRARVIQRLVDRLAPNGFLFVGHAESLTGVTDRVRYVVPTIYTTTDQPQTALRPAMPKNQGVITTR